MGATAGVVINVDEAVIRTATIQIRMLTIDKRKVTMGLFRQFKQKNFLDPDTGAQLGIPWGQINYFWQDCDALHDESGRHLHILWQDEHELYRDCVYSRPRTELKELRSSADELFETAWMLAYLAIRKSPELYWMLPAREDDRYRINRKGDSRSWTLTREATYKASGGGYVSYDRDRKIKLFQITGYDPFNSDWGRWGQKRPAPIVLSEMSEHEELAKTLSARNCDVELPSVELWNQTFEYSQRAREIRDEAVSLEKTWDANYQTLTQIEQLFIAG